MFIGHFGIGMGAKAAAPRPSLGTLFLAAQFIDLLWPTLLLLGLERVEIAPGITRMTPLDFVAYPYTHSLLAVLGWGALLGGVYLWVRKDRRGALVLALAVVSHWVLDLMVHRPDLPLWPGGPRVGMGLWNLPALAIPLELVLFGAGAWLYLTRTAPADRTGRYAAPALIAALLLIHTANLFGPPPEQVEAIAWAGHLQWLFVAWAYWADGHRQPRPRPAS
ncbi:MAG: hypothetical protein KatS3mg042_0689 [Rhodothermaceae bacterium]|nr:MAG: hypothetical protein KatS3mg042_0689 [Rhodothermaceae bacterium]